MSHPSDFPTPALGFYRARLAPLIGRPIVAVELVPGVRGLVPALIVELANGQRAAIVALSDEEGNDDGSFELIPIRREES